MAYNLPNAGRMKLTIAKFTKCRFVSKLVDLSIAAFFAAQFLLAIPHLQNVSEPLRTVPNISDADKMRIQWGALFDRLDFVRRETPPNAVILMPEDGRPEFDQYFLFPRRVIYGDADALRDNPQVEYVLITDNYPPFPVRGEKMMLDDAHGLYRLQR